MPYGELRVDTITFTNGGVDTSITVSGLAASTTGNLTVTGTVSGATVAVATGVFGSGTTGSPSITFTSDLDTGFYNSAANQVSITTSGAERLRIDGAGQIEATNIGSASAPTFSFTGDPNTGIYSPGDDQLAISTNGINRVTIDNGNSNLGRLSISGSLVVSGTTISDTITTTGALQITRSGNVKTFLSDTNSYTLEDFSAGRLIVTGSTVPTNGLYLPAANSVAISTNGAGRLFVDASGNVGVNTTSILSPVGYGYARQFGITASTSGDSTVSLNLQGSRTVDGAFADINFWHQSTSNRCWIAARREGADADVNLAFGTKNNERLRITSAGLVGIGTSSPTARLTIAGGTADNYADGILLSKSGGNAYAIYTSTNNLEFRSVTGSKHIATFDYDGRVGIGTTAPTAQLSVQESTAPTIDFYTGATKRAIIKSTAAIFNFEALTGNDITFTTNSSERARLDASGRLLVGTSSTSATATSVFQGNSTSSTGAGVIHISRGSTANLANDACGIIRFSDNSQNIRAEIEVSSDAAGGTNDYPGRIVFSTTADGASSPTERARVNSNGSFGMLCASGVDTLYLSNATTASATQFLISGRHTSSSVYGGTESFRVATNGNVQNTNNSYGSLSDIKLKENIVDATSQWSDIKALQVRKYNFKEETGQQTHTQIGLIAQEVELVSPGLVSESPDRDAEGNDLGTVTKSVNYSVLYMKAVKALQEAMERIETLEAKVAALEGA